MFDPVAYFSLYLALAMLSTQGTPPPPQLELFEVKNIAAKWVSH